MARRRCVAFLDVSGNDGDPNEIMVARNMKAAIIGAGGFVGRALLDRLRSNGQDVLPIVRTPAGLPDERSIDDLTTADWARLLRGTDAVALTAARVHIMDDRATDPLAAFRHVNRDGAAAAYRGAAEAGARRFLFVSTVKVNGEATQPGRPFRADDPPAPEDPYGISKCEAEKALTALAAGGGPELVIVRPPLVHGPGVRANFASMLKWLGRGVPLPLGAVTGNRRSLVGLDNLVDFLTLCLTHPGASGERFLVSDGRDVSTTELLRLIGEALNRPARLVPLPPALLRGVGRLAGKGPALQRLTGSLQVSIEKNCEKLGWTPPVSLEEGLRRAAAAVR